MTIGSRCAGRWPTVAGEDKPTLWLADKMCPVETSGERLRAD
ncbi:hypothetical protein ACFQYP_18910 [Nonomuraea antimicrobica]